MFVDGFEYFDVGDIVVLFLFIVIVLKFKGYVIRKVCFFNVFDCIFILFFGNS